MFSANCSAMLTGTNCIHVCCTEKKTASLTDCAQLSQIVLYRDLITDLLKWCYIVLAVLSSLAPKTTNMFHHTGNKQSTPNCPVLLVANFNPGTGSQSYSSSGKSCSRASHYRLPFYLKDMGPRYNAISVGAHEARPGHHTQVNRFINRVEKVIWPP